MPSEHLGLSEEEGIAVSAEGHHSLVHPSNPKRASIPTQGRGLFDLSPASPWGKHMEERNQLPERVSFNFKADKAEAATWDILDFEDGKSTWRVVVEGWESSLLAERKRWMVWLRIDDQLDDKL
jgi:hypothetical protein